MKMPEKHDLLTAILACLRQGIEAIHLRLQWRTFAAGRNGGAFTKTVIDATMCADIASSFVTFSASPD